MSKQIHKNDISGKDYQAIMSYALVHLHTNQVPFSATWFYIAICFFQATARVLLILVIKHQVGDKVSHHCSCSAPEDLVISLLEFDQGLDTFWYIAITEA